jgi:N-hydroxyarylamine O-acetyltransferase
VATIITSRPGTVLEMDERSDALTGADLDAYFERIAYRGAREATLATLNAIMAAHVQAIPFENLDVLLGRPIDLGAAAVVAKLVHARRGGYCFEQNGLFLHVLRALGFDARAIGARVRIDRPRDYLPPRTHQFVHVRVDGDSWLADVGIGGLSLTAALRLQLDVEQATPHEPRRIVEGHGVFFHQARFTDGRRDVWQDVCELTLDDMPPIDRELANWYTSAHPRSHFKDRLIVARAAPDGARLTLVNDELRLRRRGAKVEKHAIASADDLLSVLAREFGLTFPADTRFGPPGSPWPS